MQQQAFILLFTGLQNLCSGFVGWACLEGWAAESIQTCSTGVLYATQEKKDNGHQDVFFSWWITRVQEIIKTSAPKYTNVTDA